MDGSTQIVLRTEMQRLFVIAYTSESGCIGDATKSAIRAGYSADSAKDIGRQLLLHDQVLAAIRQENLRLMGTDLTTLAVEKLRQILDGTIKCAPGTLLDAIKTTLDRAGIVALTSDSQKPKDISQMSAGELANVVGQARDARAQLEAKLKDITPDTAPIEGEALDVTDGIIVVDQEDSGA